MSDSDDNTFYDEDIIDDLYDDDYNLFGGENNEFGDVMIMPKKKEFTILSEEEVGNRLKDDVSLVSSTLYVPEEVARLLLLHYKWNVNDVHEAWFANEENVRKAVGFMDDDIDQSKVKDEVNCGICLEDYGSDMCKSLSCRHPFCATCWKGYISSSINEGPGCLFLRCPAPKCGTAVGEGFIAEFATDAEKVQVRVEAMMLVAVLTASPQSDITGLSIVRLWRSGILRIAMNLKIQHGYLLIQKVVPNAVGQSENAAWIKRRKKARSDLEKMQSGLLKEISEKNCQEEITLSFIVEAWQQIIECRRVLKYTYAYGFYLPEGDENTKKKFFEYLQGDAEAALERLHRCAENELEDYYLEGRSPSVDFLLFRTKLLGLTNVTATYFKNLVTALENGLEYADFHVENHRES